MTQDTARPLPFIVCTACRGRLRAGGAGRETVLRCEGCGKTVAVRAGIPLFAEPGPRAAHTEGIASDASAYIALAKKEIDPAGTRSGRLFDAELSDPLAVFLDVGCGIGRNLLVLKNNGIRGAFGLDLDPDMVLAARGEFGLENLFVASAADLPAADGSVDVCLLYNTIEHVSEPRRVLAEVRRVLRPGGRLYMDAPNSRSAGDIMFRWGGRLLHGRTSHIQRFTRSSAERLAEESGFRIEACETRRGIFVDYPQLSGLPLLKRALRALFGGQVDSWEWRMSKKT